MPVRFVPVANSMNMPHRLSQCQAIILTYNDRAGQPAHRALAKGKCIQPHTLHPGRVGCFCGAGRGFAERDTRGGDATALGECLGIEALQFLYDKQAVAADDFLIEPNFAAADFGRLPHDHVPVD
jgi:hypothetical protein